MTVQNVLKKLNSNPRFMQNVTFRHTLPAQPGVYEPIPPFIPTQLADHLNRKGIAKLYSHQARSLQEVEAGENVVVVTPTASGKTLCYNLPVIKTLLENPEARALYLFPTKALAQDQVAELMMWSEELGGRIQTYTYD